MKYRLKDNVILITGKDSGKVGKVFKIKSIKINGVFFFKVLVSGINVFKRHIKGDPNKKKEGGIREKECFISISNISIFNSKTSKPDKIKYGFHNGKKVRLFKSTGEVIKNA